MDSDWCGSTAFLISCSSSVTIALGDWQYERWPEVTWCRYGEKNLRLRESFDIDSSPMMGSCIKIGFGRQQGASFTFVECIPSTVWNVTLDFVKWHERIEAEKFGLSCRPSWSDSGGNYYGRMMPCVIMLASSWFLHLYSMCTPINWKENCETYVMWWRETSSQGYLSCGCGFYVRVTRSWGKFVS